MRIEKLYKLNEVTAQMLSLSRTNTEKKFCSDLCEALNHAINMHLYLQRKIEIEETLK